MDPVSDGGWLDAATRRKMVVHTKDDRSIEGVVTLVAADGLLLWAAKLLGDREVPLAGEVWVPRSNISFVQTVRQ